MRLKSSLIEHKKRIFFSLQKRSSCCFSSKDFVKIHAHIYLRFFKSILAFLYNPKLKVVLRICKTLAAHFLSQIVHADKKHLFSLRKLISNTSSMWKICRIGCGCQILPILSKFLPKKFFEKTFSSNEKKFLVSSLRAMFEKRVSKLVGEQQLNRKDHN